MAMLNNQRVMPIQGGSLFTIAKLTQSSLGEVQITTSAKGMLSRNSTHQHAENVDDRSDQYIVYGCFLK